MHPVITMGMVPSKMITTSLLTKLLVRVAAIMNPAWRLENGVDISVCSDRNNCAGSLNKLAIFNFKTVKLRKINTA